jgi:hypothetical protein
LRPRRLAGLAGVLLCCLCVSAHGQPGFLPQATAYLIEGNGCALERTPTIAAAGQLIN